MSAHAFAKTSPVPGGRSLSRYSPLIFMKCLRHLGALLRSPGLRCLSVLLLRGGHQDVRPVPSPLAVRLALLCALFPCGRGAHGVHVCTLRLHCRWCAAWNLRPEVARTTDHRGQLPGSKHPFIAFFSTGWGSGPLTGVCFGLFVCLSVYFKPLPGSL